MINLWDTFNLISVDFYGTTVILKIDYSRSAVFYRFYNFIHIGYRNIGKKSYRYTSTSDCIDHSKAMKEKGMYTYLNTHKHIHMNFSVPC